MMESVEYEYYITKVIEMQLTYGKELFTIFRFFCMKRDWKIYVVKCKKLQRQTLFVKYFALENMK